MHCYQERRQLDQLRANGLYLLYGAERLQREYSRIWLSVSWRLTGPF
jgi:hypothetical protein